MPAVGGRQLQPRLSKGITHLRGGLEVAETGQFDVAVADGGHLFDGAGEVRAGQIANGVKLKGGRDPRHGCLDSEKMSGLR
jgi:hypothetical protein